MPVIDARRVLIELLESCRPCYTYFYDNVAVITMDETGSLTDEQVAELVIHMHEHHSKGEHRVH